MWLNCNLGKVNLELMLPAVSPMLHMSCGAPFWVRRGRTRTTLRSSDCSGSVPFCLQLFVDSLAFVCHFSWAVVSITCLVQPRTVKQCCLLRHSNGNPPCLPGENSVPGSSTSPPGASNSSVAMNPSSEPSPEFLATVVHAVKAALAAEQAFAPSPSVSTSPRRFIDHELIRRGDFWGRSPLLSSQANAFTAWIRFFCTFHFCRGLCCSR